MKSGADYYRAQLRALRATSAWAYAHGSRCSNGDHPRFREIRERDAKLVALVAEHRED